MDVGPTCPRSVLGAVRRSTLFAIERESKFLQPRVYILSMDKVVSLYAQVLLECAQNLNSIKAVQQDLQSLEEILQTEHQFISIICLPMISKSVLIDICHVMSTHLHLCHLVQKFLQTLAENRRLHLLPQIIHNFKKSHAAALGIIRGRCQTAHPMMQDQIKDLEDTLSLKFHKQVNLSMHINEELLGGFMIYIDNLMLDASLHTKLQKIKTYLGQ